MAENIYMIYENVKKKIDTLIDYNDLMESLKKEFNEEGEKDDYIFKIKDENGNEEEIPENVESEFFERDLEIYVSKKGKEIKDYSVFTSQFEPNKVPKEDQNKEHIEEIIIEKNDENDKSKEDLEKEYTNLLNENKDKTNKLIGMRKKNEKMKEELEKLIKELEDIKKKPKKPNANITNYELEIAKLKENYETKKSQLDNELSNIKKTNKKNQDKIEELKLGTEHENEIKTNLNNEQSELITKKNSISQIFERQNLINKTSKSDINVKKKKKNDFILNYIKKCFEENKKNKTDNDKKIVKEEEEKRKKMVFETFKSKLTNIKAKNNIEITKHRIRNKNDKGNEVEENNQLKQKKKELEDALINKNIELDNLKKENKKEITKIQQEIKEKKKEKKIKEDEERKKKLKEEEERKKKLKEDEAEKQRKIKEDEERKKKLKEDEAEKQRKIKEEEERKKKLKEDEERKKKLKENEEKNKKIEEEKKKNSMKNKKEKNNINGKNKNNFEEEEENKIQELMRKGTLQNMHYTYECTNLMILQQYVYQGTESTEIPLMLKNTGPYCWPPNDTKLIFGVNYKIKGKTVQLKSLDVNEEQQCNVKIEGLGKLPVGEYETGVYLNIKRNNIGKIIKIKIIIKEKEDDPIDQYIETIKKFRDEYNLDEKEYSNDDLYNILMSNEFNLEKAFMCLIGDN